MDFGDPRESLVRHDEPGVWEADNRVEERWQWGAQILDLCGLSPEEYKNSTAVTVKSIQDCGECGGGGGGQTTKSNKGTAELDDEGQLSVEFEEPTASKLYLTVTFKDGNGVENTFTMPIDKGSTSGSYDLSSVSPDEPYEITDIKVGFKEDGSDAAETATDDKYDYSVTFEGDVAGNTYYMSILCTKTDSLTDQDYLNIVDAEGEGFDYVASYGQLHFGKGEDSADLQFYAPCSYVDHWMPEGEEQQYFSAHSYDFVFLTQETVTEIKEDFTIDNDNWKKKGTVTLNGKTFNKWLRRNLTGAQCPYSVNDDTCEDYELVYTVTIKK